MKISEICDKLQNDPNCAKYIDMAIKGFSLGIAEIPEAQTKIQTWPEVIKDERIGYDYIVTLDQKFVPMKEGIYDFVRQEFGDLEMEPQEFIDQASKVEDFMNDIDGWREAFEAALKG